MSNSVVHIITGLGDGGAQAVLYRLCIHDSINQHSVISLTDQGDYGPLLRRAGAQVHCLGMARGRLTLPGLFKLFRIVRKASPDIIQTWMYHADLVGGAVARLAGLRCICWGIRHTNLEPGVTKRSTIMVARMCAALSRSIPARIICCAKRAAEVHGDLGYPIDKIVVIQNGYDLRRFQPNRDAGERFRAELGISREVPLVGMVGRFDPQKDHRNLINALEIVAQRGHNFLCLLVGDQMDAGNATLMQWLVRGDLGACVIAIGSRRDIPAVMNALDVHVLSSCGEAFPNVLAEAMACGTPCVATDVGDASVIVGDTGWLVPPSSPVSLADAIQDALGNLQDSERWSLRQRMAREHIANNFSLDAMVSAYQKVWMEVMKSSGK